MKDDKVIFLDELLANYNADII